MLTTSPKLVRTSINMLQLSPTNTVSAGQQQQQQLQQQQQTSPTQSQLVKKKRLGDGLEQTSDQQQHEPSADAMGYKRRIIEHKLRRLRAIRDNYNENLSEYYFLHTGGNIVNYQSWKKKPHSNKYQMFLKKESLERDSNKEELLSQSSNTTVSALTSDTSNASSPTTTTTTTTLTKQNTVVIPKTLVQPIVTTALITVVTSVVSTATTVTTSSTSISSSGTSTVGCNTPTKNLATTALMTSQSNVEVAVSGGMPVAVSTILPPAVAQLSQQGKFFFLCIFIFHNVFPKLSIKHLL